VIRVIPANDHSCVTAAHFLSILIKPLQNISHYVGYQMFSCDINFSLTYSSWCVKCVSALTVCRHWLCVSTDCVSTLTVCQHWLCVGTDCVSALTVCRHWLRVGTDCVSALTVCRHWLCVNTDCLSTPIVCRHWLCWHWLCVNTVCRHRFLLFILRNKTCSIWNDQNCTIIPYIGSVVDEWIMNMDHFWDDADKANLEVFGENLVRMSLCLP